MRPRDTLQGALHEFSTQREAKGEICLVVEGAPTAADAALALNAALATLSGGAAESRISSDSSSGKHSDMAGGSEDPAAALRARVREALLGGASVSAVARQLALQNRLSRSKLYKLVLVMEQELKRELPQQRQ